MHDYKSVVRMQGKNTLLGAKLLHTQACIKISNISEGL